MGLKYVSLFRYFSVQNHLELEALEEEKNRRNPKQAHHPSAWICWVIFHQKITHLNEYNSHTLDTGIVVLRVLWSGVYVLAMYNEEKLLFKAIFRRKYGHDASARGENPSQDDHHQHPHHYLKPLNKKLLKTYHFQRSFIIMSSDVFIISLFLCFLSTVQSSTGN